MQIRSREQFVTIRTEGSILPADLLQRIVEGDRELEGLTPSDYHLINGEKLNEATSRSWNRLQGAWANFCGASEKLSKEESGTTVTRERWLLPLFQELGYGRLQTAKAIEIDKKTYPISHSWQNTATHLVGFRVDLDQRTAGIAGASRSSPHSLVQELLNKSSNYLWAFVSNGLRLRILRDNVSLTRQAFVEFNLEAMMNGEVYSDFVLLWLLCHQSRVEGTRPEDCWLEQWSKAIQEQGTRALDQLRNGVEGAITSLGRGFLSHKENQNLREKLKSGNLSTQNFYRQLLRLVYRLLFLFVAEDRELLLDPNAESEPKKRYRQYYSTQKLRRLAERRAGTRHSDLFYSLKLIFKKLGSDKGCLELGLPALGSFLFSENATPDLDPCQISNNALLDSIESLAYITHNHSRRPVDYKNLRSEELGSVYEALLELHPELNVEVGQFELRTAGGHERKTTGSYYTPDGLVQCILDSVLEPVLNEACKKDDAENAILNLKICDPACGSGHFLISASHRVAKRLAALRTGDVEPSPEATRKALRDVIGHCIYGVDLNPMAVELAKVSLWMEALEPGKPLSFLDHRLQCGNSLMGTTPALMKGGIPDSAFKEIEGDDKDFCRIFTAKNKSERQTQQRNLFDAAGQPWKQISNFATNLSNLSNLPDETIEDVHRKQKQYEIVLNSDEYSYGLLCANAWCSAFVWKKTNETPHPITEEVFRRIEEKPSSIPSWISEEIGRLITQFQFFHWHLAFPEVFSKDSADGKSENEETGWTGGFDLIVGNPPWERVNLEARQFFANIRPDIANASTTKRRKLIAQLKTDDPKLFYQFVNAQRQASAEIGFYKNSGLYPHLNQARLNTYLLFTEIATKLCGKSGRVGIIIPSGIATDDVSKKLFGFLFKDGRIESLIDFENRDALFPGIHRSYKFCLFSLRGNSRSAPPCFAFFLHNISEISQADRFWTLTEQELNLLSPISGLCPTFRSSLDREIVLCIYHRVLPLSIQQKLGSDWIKSNFLIMFRSDDSSDLYRTIEQLSAIEPSPESFPRLLIEETTYVPVWESKLLHQFDHRFSTFSSLSLNHRKRGFSVEVNNLEKESSWIAIPRYWVPKSSVKKVLQTRGWNHEWTIGYRDITNATNERTAIASVLPEGGAAQPLNLFLPESSLHACVWIAVMNSFVFDYIARQRIGGVHLNITTCRQLPMIAPCNLTEEQKKFILDRVLELSFTSPALTPFAKECGFDGPPFPWNEKRRFLLRCELDAALFHFYIGSKNDSNQQPEFLTKYFPTPRDVVDYIMETFPIVKRKDEDHFGDYRTKNTILAIYDGMADAIHSGKPFQTRLDPPPADPRVAHSS